MAIIGIDLGTTNTCAAFVSNKIPKVIPIEGGYNTMPSVVTWLADGSVLVGQQAKELMRSQPKRTLHESKRLIGRQFTSRTVQELRHRFAYEVVADAEGRATIDLDGKQISPAQTQTKIFQNIKRYAEIHLGEGIPDAVIAVPAYFSDQQRSVVKEAGKEAGFNVKRIVNEPTAAALAYGFNRGFDQKILIYDLGGGTFDISILELTDNIFHVRATGGDTYLGGADFDRRVLDWMLRELERQHRIELRGDENVIQALRPFAEKAKIELSLLANTRISIPSLPVPGNRFLDVNLMLDREQLNTMSEDLVERTLSVIDDLLNDCGVRRNDIDEIILVGGQTRMPLVSDRLTKHLGKEPRKGVHPDECVALGAALLGDSLEKIDAVTLLDALSVPIQLQNHEDVMETILAKHTALPAKTKYTVHIPEGADCPCEVHLFQGEGQSAIQSEYLGTLILAEEARPADIELELSLDEEGMLHVVAKSEGGNLPLSLVTLERRELAPMADVRESSPPQTTEEASRWKGIMKSFLGSK